MDDQRLKTIDELGVTVASIRDSAGDEELVAAAKGGDELAFKTIVKRHRQRIFALALRYTRSPEDAEDIVQQTFQRAFIHLQGFEVRSSFSTWLTSIVINQATGRPRQKSVSERLRFTSNAAEFTVATRTSGCRQNASSSSEASVARFRDFMVSPPPQRVDLNEVTFIDESGERLLRMLASDGAQFTASGIYAKHVIEHLNVQRKRRPSAALIRNPGTAYTPPCKLSRH
jgi:RNA polymerase sigma factor (sigma-70 family)